MSAIILKLGFGAVFFIFTAAIIYAINNFYRQQARAGQGSGAPDGLIAVSVEEQRRHPRVDITYPVKIKTAQGTVAAQTKNISLGGAFICCPEPLPLGQNFSVTIAPPVYPSVTLAAEVVWSNANVPDEKIVNRGMGIKFLKITPKDREILDKIISADTPQSPA